jgi:3-methyladenine DNA glycosylase AlkD
MNGEVVERMSAHGVDYALNYGVAIHTLKEIAAEYAPDTKLARLLYQQQVRDLQILACHIAAPDEVTFAEEEFWRKAVSNGEIAEQLSTLLAHSPEHHLFVKNWIQNADSNIQYCALLIVAKNGSSENLQTIANFVSSGVDCDFQRLRVIATIISKHYKNEHIAPLLNLIRTSENKTHRLLNEEIYIFDE